MSSSSHRHRSKTGSDGAAAPNGNRHPASRSSSRRSSRPKQLVRSAAQRGSTTSNRDEACARSMASTPPPPRAVPGETGPPRASADRRSSASSSGAIRVARTAHRPSASRSDAHGGVFETFARTSRAPPAPRAARVPPRPRAAPPPPNPGRRSRPRPRELRGAPPPRAGTWWSCASSLAAARARVQRARGERQHARRAQRGPAAAHVTAVEAPLHAGRRPGRRARCARPRAQRRAPRLSTPASSRSRRATAPLGFASARRRPGRRRRSRRWPRRYERGERGPRQRPPSAAAARGASARPSRSARYGATSQPRAQRRDRRGRRRSVAAAPTFFARTQPSEMNADASVGGRVVSARIAPARRSQAAPSTPPPVASASATSATTAASARATLTAAHAQLWTCAHRSRRPPSSQAQRRRRPRVALPSSFCSGRCARAERVAPRTRRAPRLPQKTVVRAVPAAWRAGPTLAPRARVGGRAASRRPPAAAKRPAYAARGLASWAPACARSREAVVTPSTR